MEKSPFVERAMSHVHETAGQSDDEAFLSGRTGHSPAAERADGQGGHDVLVLLRRQGLAVGIVMRSPDEAGVKPIFELSAPRVAGGESAQRLHERRKQSADG